MKRQREGPGLEDRAEGGLFIRKGNDQLERERELTYSCQAGPRHGEVSSSIAGPRRWMNAVAMMTPEPKYFANLDGGKMVRKSRSRGEG